jgi:hypothetical protein
MYLENNQRYEGNFEYGVPSGKGKLYMLDENIYEGNFVNGK